MAGRLAPDLGRGVETHPSRFHYSRAGWLLYVPRQVPSNLDAA